MTTWAFVAHEARTQWRSLRFRVLAGVYLVASLAPVVVLRLSPLPQEAEVGAGIHAGMMSWLQPMLVAVLSALLSMDALSRERHEGSFPVLALCGLTNAGYTLRRWAAVQCVVLALSLGPLVVTAGVATSVGFPPSDPGAFLWPWLLHVVPVSLATGALAIALGTVAGGPIPAALLGGLLFVIGFQLFNDVAARLGFVVQTPAEWLGLSMAGAVPRVLQSAWSGRFWFGLPGSEGPVDVAMMAERWFSRGAITIGLAALALAVTPLFLRRSGPDVRPWRIRADHPLRTYLRWMNDLRTGATPDWRLTAGEWLLVLAGAAGLAASCLVVAERTRRYEAWAMERWNVERSEAPPPTPAGITPLTWRVTGRLAADGTVALAARTAVRNDGPEEVSHLAFAMNPGLVVRGAAADRGRVSTETAWDRVSATLDPPLSPGEARAITLEVTGRAVEREFELPAWGHFLQRMKVQLDARVASEKADLAASASRRRARPGRVFLWGADLAPVLRHDPWRLVHDGRHGQAVVGDDVRPLVQIEVDLEVPGGHFLADACGNVVEAEAGTPRLRGTCVTAAQAFAVVGGRLERSEAPEGWRAVAVLPSHRRALELHRPALEAAGRVAERAWPGRGGLRGVVALELPGELTWQGPLALMQAGSPHSPRAGVFAVGRLVLIQEGRLMHRQPLAAEGLAWEVLLSDLWSRRSVRREHQGLLRQVYSRVVSLQLGLGDEEGTTAVIEGDSGPRSRYELSLIGSQWRSGRVLGHLLADLRARVGWPAIVGGLEDFVDGGDAPGDAEELFERIAARAGTDLSQFHADFVEGEAVPELTLADVVFEEIGEGAVVTGRVVNRGGGHVLCPVVLRTELDAVETIVRVGPHSGAPFSLATSRRPREVLLDPSRRCFRYRPKGGVGITERVEP